jgi:hypothetical protein
MEALTRMVADSLARHGLDRPVDPRRLQWSRWFRCDSTHSLLTVPSKPGIFALAEEVMDLGPPEIHVGTDAFVRPAEQRSPADETRRMLAVVQFAEDDDMAFTLDRMFTKINPMRDRLGSGRCFLRFVVIEDQSQRRSICAALNQWMVSSAEKTTGLPSDFSSSLEFVARTPSSVTAGANSSSSASSGTKANVVSIVRNLDSGADKNLHCPQPLPSGF